MSRVIAPNGRSVDFPSLWPTAWHWLATAAALLLSSLAIGLLAGVYAARPPLTHTDAAYGLATASLPAVDCTTTTCLIYTPRTNP